jgi:hypothetical protein
MSKSPEQGILITEVIARLRESENHELKKVADLIDTLIEERQDAINKREADLAAWRRQNELLREMTGRSLEDVGPRRIVLDLLNSPERRVDAVNAQLLEVVRFYANSDYWGSGTSIPVNPERDRWLQAMPTYPAMTGYPAHGWSYADAVLKDLGLK